MQSKHQDLSLIKNTPAAVSEDYMVRLSFWIKNVREKKITKQAMLLLV